MFFRSLIFFQTPEFKKKRSDGSLELTWQKIRMKPFLPISGLVLSRLISPANWNF